MFSSAVRTGSRLKNWNTKPTWRRRRSVSSRSPIVVISRSSTATCPEVGRSSPARMCMSVDLPEPEGPMTAVNWPAGTSRDTPPSACTAASPSPYWRVTSVARTAADASFAGSLPFLRSGVIRDTGCSSLFACHVHDASAASCGGARRSRDPRHGALQGAAREQCPRGGLEHATDHTAAAVRPSPMRSARWTARRGREPVVHVEHERTGRPQGQPFGAPRTPRRRSTPERRRAGPQRERGSR